MGPSAAPSTNKKSITVFSYLSLSFWSKETAMVTKEPTEGLGLKDGVSTY